MALTKRSQQLALSVIGACLVGYFLYHTIQGERGWLAMMRLQHEVTEAQATLNHVRTEREELAHRVQLLHPDSLDPDLLEEKSRELLNYSKPNEIIILTPNDKIPAQPKDISQRNITR